MQEPQPIVEVALPQAAQDALRQGDLGAALAAQQFPQQHRNAIEEVARFAARLSPAQHQILLNALSHSLGASHGARVSFSRRAVGYELEAVQLSVTDATVTEEGTIAPLAITFAYKG
jgi:hypothetical protein